MWVKHETHVCLVEYHVLFSSLLRLCRCVRSMRTTSPDVVAFLESVCCKKSFHNVLTLP